MRFSFLKQRVYRNQFILYTIVLSVVCFFVCIGLLNTVIGNQLSNSRQQVQSLFQSAESSINAVTQRIDSYFLQLYATRNYGLLQDLGRFLGSSAEEYVLARLETVPAGSTEVSFIESMSEFADSNHSMLRQVFCVSAANQQVGNVICFNQNGSVETIFQAKNTFSDPVTDNLDEGFHYVKKVSDRYGEALGEVIFTIDPKAVFPSVPATQPGDLAVIGRSGAYFLTDADESTREALRSIYAGDASTGTLPGLLFSQKQFSVFASDEHRYKLIYLINISDVLRQSPALLLLPVGGICLIFLTITSLLALRMTVDARYLSQIVMAIGDAKDGRFTQIEVGRRRDEYGIIAEEFNVMSDALNDYIDRELLLQLRQKDAEMRMLQQQIHPHFLYNTLEIIRSRALMNHDDDVAEAVYNLGAMFRTVVKSENVITVEQELGILMKYLHLMEFKYSNRFYYRIDVADDVLQLPTVKFWMQPLLENFFVHGYDMESDTNLVVLSAARCSNAAGEDTLHFEVINNGSKIDSEKLSRIQSSLSHGGEEAPGGSIGLANICHRLRYFYGESLKMHIENNTEAGITVSVDAVLNSVTGIPLQKEDDNV